MMGFDLVSWLVGYAGSKTADLVLTRASDASLAKELNSAIIGWASVVGHDLEPATLFPVVSNASFQQPGPRLEELRAAIRQSIMPTTEQWISPTSSFTHNGNSSVLCTAS